jgi:hypothetical protein
MRALLIVILLALALAANASARIAVVAVTPHSVQSGRLHPAATRSPSTAASVTAAPAAA